MGAVVENSSPDLMSLKQEEINIFGIVLLATGLSLTLERTSELLCSSRWRSPKVVLVIMWDF